MFVSYSKTSFRYGLSIAGDKIQSARAQFGRTQFCWDTLYVFLCLCPTHSMPCSLLDDATSKDLTKIWGEGENDWSVFSIFYLIISCFTYDQLFVGRCHFKDFWSEGSRKRGREWGFHLLCQVRLESMSKRGEVDILITTKWIFDLLEKYLLKQGNWVIEFWYELI